MPHVSQNCQLIGRAGFVSRSAGQRGGASSERHPRRRVRCSNSIADASGWICCRSCGACPHPQRTSVCRRCCLLVQAPVAVTAAAPPPRQIPWHAQASSPLHPGRPVHRWQCCTASCAQPRGGCAWSSMPVMPASQSKQCPLPFPDLQVRLCARVVVLNGMAQPPRPELRQHALSHAGATARRRNARVGLQGRSVWRIMLAAHSRHFKDLACSTLGVHASRTSTCAGTSRARAAQRPAARTGTPRAFSAQQDLVRRAGRERVTCGHSSLNCMKDVWPRSCPRQGGRAVLGRSCARARRDGHPRLRQRVPSLEPCRGRRRTRGHNTSVRHVLATALHTPHCGAPSYYFKITRD